MCDNVLEWLVRTRLKRLLNRPIIVHSWQRQRRGQGRQVRACWFVQFFRQELHHHGILVQNEPTQFAFDLPRLIGFRQYMWKHASLGAWCCRHISIVVEAPFLETAGAAATSSCDHPYACDGCCCCCSNVRCTLRKSMNLAAVPQNGPLRLVKSFCLVTRGRILNNCI